MQTYTNNPLNVRATEETREFAVALSAFCTHELTLHTRLRVAGCSGQTREGRVFRAQAVMRYFQLRFFRALAGNTWRRFPHRIPVFIPALEGIQTQRDKLTLHWHVLIGNLPTTLDEQQLLEKAGRIWTTHYDAGTDIEAQPLYYSRGYGRYATKEVNKFNYDCVDYNFFKAPAHIIDRLLCCS